jgi:transposase InsO family protein
MDGKGRCMDNIFVERLWRSLKYEEVYLNAYATVAEAKAKARGVRLGRKPKLTPHQKREAIRRRDVDGDTLADIARTFNVSRSTISRLTA